MIGISFLVDGFNLYHSLDEVARRTKKPTKWLDLRSLLAGGLPALPGKHEIREIRYFSAYAHHRLQSDPGTIRRHKAFLACLRDSGVEVQLGRFKKRRVKCKICGGEFEKYEEKETDVAVAVATIEALARDSVERVAIVSGDTDLTPAIVTGKRMFPEKEVGVVFPCGRSSEELKRSADFHWRIRGARYLENQFPDPYRKSDGGKVAKPSGW